MHASFVDAAPTCTITAISSPAASLTASATCILSSVLSKKPSPVEPQAYIPFTPNCLYFATRAFIASVFMLSFSSYIAFKAQKPLCKSKYRISWYYNHSKSIFIYYITVSQPKQCFLFLYCIFMNWKYNIVNLIFYKG